MDELAKRDANGTTPAPPKQKVRIGLRLIQLSAALHVLGGVNDLLMQRLQPFHEAFLGYSSGAVPSASAGLVLALLHALGAALIGGGVTMWWLAGLMRREARRDVLWLVAVLSLCLEGSVGARMLQLGLVFGYIPLGICLMALLGVACVAATPPAAPATASR
ncbi:MAG: hypothetical protein AB7K71_41780 [Polyangiaceae bacterium]